MSKDISDIDDPRLVRALAHPIRVRILALLDRGTRTPKQLAADLELPLENVSYHVRALRELGFIELERTRQVRGAVEHHYRAGPRPRIAGGAWEAIPGIVKDALLGASLSAVAETVNEAARTDGFSRAHATVARHTFVVDEQGYGELSTILEEALARMDAAGDAARKRLGEGEAVNATAVALLFDTPDAAD